MKHFGVYRYSLVKISYLLLILFFALFLFSERLFSASVNHAKLFIANPEYDFGKVAQGETVVHEFAIRNDGDIALEIKDVRPT